MPLVFQTIYFSNHNLKLENNSNSILFKTDYILTQSAIKLSKGTSVNMFVVAQAAAAALHTKQSDNITLREQPLETLNDGLIPPILKTISTPSAR
jgi:hypothetical protein